MRWARTTHTGLTHDTAQLSGGRTMHGWENDHTAVWAVCHPSDDIRVEADDQTGTRLRLDTCETQKILDSLVAVAVLPARFSSIHQGGRIDGIRETTQALSAAQQAYGIVRDAGYRAFGDGLKS